MTTTLMLAFSVLLGLVIGSFMNVLIYRLPRGLSIAKPRSFCPLCKKTIPWYENIPLVSFAFLGGRCSNPKCRKPISFQYPLVELLTGSLFLYLFLTYGFSFQSLFYAYFFCGLIVIGGIDLTHQLIPDAITIPGILLGLVMQILNGTWLLGLLGAGFGGGLILLMRVLGGWAWKKEVMGMGDVFLVAMIGAYAGFPDIILAIFIAAFLGAVFGIIYLSATRQQRETPIPFGPFLGLGGALIIILKLHLVSILEIIVPRF